MVVLNAAAVRRLPLEEAREMFDSAAESWIGLGRSAALAAIRRPGESSEFEPSTLEALRLIAPSLQAQD